MRLYGIVRRIDELGRVVIPKEMRKSLAIENGDEVEILLTGDSVSVRKYEPFCVFCGGKDELVALEDKFICRTCREKLAAQKNK